jgi:hypothetical protein
MPIAQANQGEVLLPLCFGKQGRTSDMSVEIQNTLIAK